MPPRTIVRWWPLVAAALAAAHAATLPKFHHARAATPCASLWHKKMAKHNEVVTARNQILAARPEAFEVARNSFDAFEASYTCHSERRVGGLVGDGGKFVCGEPSHFQAAPCLVYSVGSSGDVAFEKDVIAKYGCEVHTFDPSGPTDVLKAAVEATGAKFYAWGIGPEDGTFSNADMEVANPLLPIHEIVARLGHEGRHIDIFKIDCENCEYESFDKLWPYLASGKVSIGQIQVEMHIVEQSMQAALFRPVPKFFRDAEHAGFMIFHKERNHWGCAGYMCVEYSLIHRDEAHKLFHDMHCA